MSLDKKTALDRRRGGGVDLHRDQLLVSWDLRTICVSATVNVALPLLPVVLETTWQPGRAMRYWPLSRVTHREQPTETDRAYPEDSAGNATRIEKRLPCRPSNSC